MPPSGRELSIDELLGQSLWVRGLVRGLVSDEHVAEDVVQATWLAAIERPPAVRVSARAWLRSVASHAVFRIRRRSELRARAEQGHETALSPEATDDVVARAEIHRALANEVMALAEPARTTILLRYFDGLTLAEIARGQGVPESTVRARHHRALAELRSRLEPTVRPERLRDQRKPGGGPIGVGVLVMTSKAKLSIALGVVAAAFVTVGIWQMQARAWLSPAAADPRANAIADAAALPTSDPTARTRDAGPIDVRPFRETESFAIEGRIREHDGAPIEGARIGAVPYNLDESLDLAAVDRPGGWPRVITSGSDGGFRIELRRAAAAFVALAESPRHVPKTVTIWPDELRGRVEIVLTRGTSVEGVVRTLALDPLAGARISLRWFLGGIAVRRDATSAPDGRYRLDGLPWSLERGRFLLEAVADGFAPVALHELPDVDATGMVAKDLYLPRGATIEGVVVDAETGAPIPAARVVLWTSHRVQNPTRADGSFLRNRDQMRAFRDLEASADGTFRIEHVPSWAVHPAGSGPPQTDLVPLGGVAASAPGHAPTVVPLVVPDESATQRVVLRCKKAARVRGRVVDPAGRPVPSVHVWRSADPQEDSDGWPPEGVFEGLPGHEAITDTDGRYLFAAVPTSTRGPATVRLSAQTFAWPQVVPAVVSFAITGSADVDVPDLVLAPDFERSAVLLVLAEDDTPAWGAAAMEIVDDGGFESRTPLARTDRDGRARLRFEKTPAAGRPYRVVVRAAGFAPALVEIAPRASAPAEATVTLRRGHSVSGTVAYTDGSIPRGIQIVVADGKEPVTGVFFQPESRLSGEVWPKVYATATTADDGSFEVRDLPAGPYHVAARVRFEEAPVSASVSDIPSDATDVRLVISRAAAEPAGALVVTCSDKASGAPVLRCRLTLGNADAWRIGAATAPGVFSFDALQPGTWELTVSSPEMAPFRAKVEIEAKAEPRRFAVELERGVVLRGRVLHPEGKAFIRASIDLVGSGNDSVVWVPDQGSIRVAPDGSFQVGGLRPGARIGVVVDDSIGPGESATYLTRKSDYVLVPVGRAEFAADFPVISGSWVIIAIKSDRLFGPNTRDPANRALAARSRLEILNPEGVAVYSSTGVYDNLGMVLPVGRYVVRLEVPDLKPVEKTIVVSGAAEASVTLEPE